MGLLAATALGGLVVSTGRVRSVGAEASTARLPVSVHVPELGTSALLHDGRALTVQLRMRSRARVRVTPFLQAGDRRVYGFDGPRSLTLSRGRWRTVSFALGSAGRSALAECPTAALGVRVSARRLHRAREVSRPLRLEAPECAPFFGPAAEWNAPLARDAPLDRDSRAITATLRAMVDDGYRSKLPPTINTEAYTPPIYTVGADQPVVPVQLDQEHQYATELAVAFSAVPLPPAARTAPGTDSELVLYQPATDTMWEFWRLRREGGAWVASWGGRLDHASQAPGHFAGAHSQWGASASSLALAGGTITARDIARGEIDHALSLGIPRARAGAFALPAQRSDGVSTCPHAIPEGAHFRLDPALDVDALKLPRAVAMIARAAQRYGIFVRDQADAVAFYAQSVVSLPRNPYPALFDGQAPYDLLRTFPWSRLQLVRMDLREEPHDEPPLFPAPGQSC